MNPCLINRQRAKNIMFTELKIEHEISHDEHEQITKLRNKSFPDASRERSYFKQLPHFRILVKKDEVLLGHLGIDHRVIRVGDKIITIFGIIDLFVSESHQGNGVATSLLEEVTKLAKKSKVDYLLLHTFDGRIYSQNGFRVISPYLKSLWLYDFENYGVGIERLDERIYIKQISDKPWPDGTVDLMGYLF